MATAAIAFMALNIACGEAKFKIKGEIYGADNTPVILEKPDFHGNWVAIDSTRTSRNGAFSISRTAPASPEIFRLLVDGKFVYVPVDSTETITVTSSLEKFGNDFSLSGSPNAEALERFEKELMAYSANSVPDSLNNLKKKIYTAYIQPNQGSILSYYILTKLIDGKPIFDPNNPDDFKYFAAVATGFSSVRPDDPHTALLEQTSLEAMKKRNSAKGNVREVVAEEISIIDIDLPDEKGVNRKLSDVVGNGKPTVLIFSLMTHPDSPALNIALSQIFNQKAGNVNFYQVSIDGDQYAWRDAAVNLPWTTVLDVDGEYSRALRSYNVNSLPVFFIYNSNGELSSRAESIEDLSRQL